MFDALTDRLQGVMQSLKGHGRLTAEDVDAAMREIRLALLEADVNFKVVREFVAHVKERALGAEVMDSLTPAQQVVKIVNEELVELMGSGDSKLAFSGHPPTVILLAGLTAIPSEIPEAAAVDGAGFFRTLFQITIPMMLPIINVAVLFGAIFTFTDMTVIYILTRGGPYDTTQVIPSEAFFTGILGSDLAEGAAISIFLVPVLVIAAYLVLRSAHRAEVT